MKYLSWDIGIKNLSYCFFEKIENKYNILNWEIINIGEKPKLIPECQGLKKNKDKCIKASFCYNLETKMYFCKTHNKGNKLIEIKKPKCCYEIKDGSLCNKKFTYYQKDNCYLGYCTKHIKSFDLNDFNKCEKKKDKQNELEMISENLIKEMDNRKFLLGADVITIENQPAFKNPKMKSVQMILYTYFLIRGRMDTINKIDRILFLSANNKLKIKLLLNKRENYIEIKNNIEKSIVTKNKYKKNKESAKLFCLDLLSFVEETEKWKYFFNNHKKRDDLADTFLMNIYQIQIDNPKEFI
jgi:hypothetical protein